MEINLEKISVSFVITVFCFFIAISPGFVLIYLGSKELFFQLDNFRLTVLSMAITMPTILVTTIALNNVNWILRSQYKRKSKTDFIEKDFILACIFSIFPYYFTIDKIIQGKLPLKIENITANCVANIGLFTIMTSFAFCMMWIFERKKGKTIQNTPQL